MLSRKHRISKELFKSLGNRSAALHTPLFSVRITPLNSAPTKASFVVSSKISPKAAVRNRLKRFGYELVRLALPTLKPTQLVFYFKKEAALVKPPELKKEIETILKKYSL